MKDYHDLENEVLAIFRQLNEDENNQEIEKLLNVFQKYWKSYQDNWPSRYWDIYNLVFEENQKFSDSEKNNNKETNESSKYNIKENQFKVNNLEDESLISIGNFKNGIEQQNEIDKEKEKKNKSPFYINNESLLINYCQEKIKRSKKSNKGDKNKDADSLTNLDEIDKELDDLMEKSFRGLNDDSPKNRSCLDCKIF